MITNLLAADRGVLRVLERNARANLRMWPLFLSGLVEPLLYLLSIGVGLTALVGPVSAPDGRAVSYEEFLAPAMLAVSAMNTAVINTTFVFFHKFKYAGTFDAMLTTPLDVRDMVRGELAWALACTTAYACVFLATMAAMGLTGSAWCVLAVPAATLIGFAFAGAGLGLATFMRSYVDFDYVHVVVTPLFLFSATFFPIDRYPSLLAQLLRLSPLYQGIALQRALVAGHLTPGLLIHVGFLTLMGWLGLRLASRRLRLLLQP
ncbi:MAG TPA: ABC transporter permease [Micromonosporaceae bacterium]|nr:ABC transporter permease [Micromonosporaceae bacterium]